MIHLAYSFVIMENFQYEPLPTNNERDFIRIIELQPGSLFDLICCHIKSVRLSQRPKYEALSYCWGEPTTSKTVICNGKHLPITTNLYKALHQLRYDSGIRTLWVDAICINQRNVDERNQHVGIMLQVYQAAGQVVIWLGPEANNSQLGMALVPKLVAANKKREETDDARTIHELRNVGIRQIYGLPPSFDNAWRALFTILRRPWFGRGWVVQEVAVNRSAMFCCGRDVVPFDDFVRALMLSADIGVAHIYLSSNYTRFFLVMFTREAYKFGYALNLLPLLLRHRTALTTDSRDKIFAFYGLADDADQNSYDIKIDYRRTFQEVYREVAVRMMIYNKNLDVLSVPNENESFDFPSWVPDFSSPCLTISLMGYVCRRTY